MKKIVSIFIALLLLTTSVFAQEKRPTVSLPKNTVALTIGGAGFIYALSYERQTKQIGILNFFAKGSAYLLPEEMAMVISDKNMGSFVEVGFKVGRNIKKLSVGAGIWANYSYRSDFSPSFPVKDGSHRYHSTLGYTANICYQLYFNNNKCRFEFGGCIIYSNKEKYDGQDSYSERSGSYFRGMNPIPLPMIAFAYTF